MNKKKKAEKKDAKAEDSPTGYKDHPRRSASRNPVGTQPQSGSFLSFLSPDTLNGLISIIAYRLLLSLYVRSYFAPDEYWQSVEIAHKMVFGYGYETWEWTIPTPIRSTLHPLIYAIPYKLLQFLSLDTPFMIAYSPRLIQGGLLALTDVYLYKVAKATFHDQYLALLTLLLNLCSWFVNYAMVRTLSNSVETTLLLIAYYYWTKIGKQYSRADTIVAVLYAIAFAIRPTSGIVCATLVVAQICTFGFSGVKNLFRAFFTGALPVFLLGVAVDSWYFGSFQVTMLNFAKVNIFAGISVFYGTHGTLWYVTAGFPLMLLTYVPFSYYGLYKMMREREDCTVWYVVVTYLTVMSLLAHKEERFMMPILPYLILMAGYALTNLKRAAPKLGLGLLIFVVITQLLFLGVWNNTYRVGSLPVMDELRTIPEDELRSVYFITDCHATPFYSHLHRNIPMAFPTCPPPLNESMLYNDKMRLFNNTEKFVSDVLDQTKYSHLVMASHFENATRNVLKDHGYVKIREIFHSIFDETPDGFAYNVKYLIYKREQQ